MALKYLIVVGDPTTAGGEAIEGTPGIIIECTDGVSRPLVRVGDAVMCGQCGPTKVTQGAPLIFGNGALAAYDGSQLACGHQMVAKMQQLHRVEVADTPSRSSSSSFNSVGETYASSVRTKGDNVKYALQFQAIDSETGDPLPHCKYVLTRADGRTKRGQCDANGLTEVISSEMPEQVSIHFAFTSPLGNPIPKSDLI